MHSRFALQFGGACFEAGVELVEAVLGGLYVGGQRLGRVAPLLHFSEFAQAKLLPIDEFAEADFEVSRDGLGFLRALGRDVRQHWVEGVLNEEVLRDRAIGESYGCRRFSGLWRDGQVEQNSGLFDAHGAGLLGLNGEEAAVDLVAATVLNRGGEEVEGVGDCDVQIVEYGAVLEVGGSVFQEVLANGFEKWVARCDPFHRGVFFEELFVEGDVLVLASEFAEAGLEALADGPELAGHAPDAIDFESSLVSFGWMPEVSADWTKKSSITSGTRRRSFASADLPMIAERFSSRLARISSLPSVDASES